MNLHAFKMPLDVDPRLYHARTFAKVARLDSQLSTVPSRWELQSNTDLLIKQLIQLCNKLAEDNEDVLMAQFADTAAHCPAVDANQIAKHLAMRCLKANKPYTIKYLVRVLMHIHLMIRH